MSSPARAPSRRNARSAGTSPRIVTHRLRGPRVVSPPTRSTPCRCASAWNPRANAASHAGSLSGNAPARSAQRGVAPIAAISERLTASVLWPSRSGSAPAKKCRPSTSMSTDTTNSQPDVGTRSAASSPTPSATDSDRGGRVKKRSISSNSFTRECRHQLPPAARSAASALISSARNSAATLSNTPLTNLWPSVPP